MSFCDAVALEADPMEMVQTVFPGKKKQIDLSTLDTHQRGNFYTYISNTFNLRFN